MHSAIPDLELGELTLRFPHDAASGRVGLMLFPTALARTLVARRSGLGELPFIQALPGSGNPPAQIVDSLVQVKLAGDAYSGRFAQGHTMRDAASVSAFRFCGQEVTDVEAAVAVITRLESDAGYRIDHRILWRKGDHAVEISATLLNDSDRPLVLEMLSSFSLGGITPFHRADAPERLRVHRFRSAWSAEARIESRTIEELHLERSWSGASASSERFGQIGTMPVRRWFPFVAVEDTGAGVLWGAQLAWAGSWQMEIFRQHDDVCLSGGLADREFGHWTKTLAPGEELTTPAATVTCVHGDLDALCDRLTATHARAADRHPVVEHDLPIIFNEWCATWGEPRHDKVVAMADRLAGSEVRYLVIDAGWYRAEGNDWSRGHGDWVPSARLFPDGLAATARAIRERGLIPGLWFEMETVGSQSTAFGTMAGHLLKRDGFPLMTGDRRFWDLNDDDAVDYLTERVIRQLESGGFGYLKVDYNETLGIGCDHPDGLGEGLRRQVLGSYRFFEKIRARLPDLVIENCASGGHRLEPSLLACTAMSSFSDAHELIEIPVIAARLHRLMLPRQSQIWAVLRRTDSDQRLAYSLTATFLGRMCLSGEIEELTDEQWSQVLAAQRLYRQAAPVIKQGISRCFGSMGESWRYPRGWQGVFRTAADGSSALAVLHAFEDAPGEVVLPAGGGWRIEGAFPDDESLSCDREGVRWRPRADFSAVVALLKRV